MPTLADDLKAEEELLRRRFVHATRPQGPLSMQDAVALCARMDGRNLAKEAAESRADALEAAIQRFRDCGVDLDRMEIQERRGVPESVLCVDGVPRFTWRLNIVGAPETY